MGWTKALKRIRRWEHPQMEQVRKWTTRYFHEQGQKQEQYFKMFIDGKLTKETLIDLLDTNDAHRNIPESDRKDFIKKFDTLTENDVAAIMINVFPKEFSSINFCIESMVGKPENKFTPSEWNPLYNTAYKYYSKERHNLTTLLNEFWDDDVYKEFVSNGHSDEELFSKFVETCSSNGVHPIYCDVEVDGYYKLLDLEHYVRLLSKRTNAIASELRTKAKEVQAIQAKGIDLKLPAVNGEFREQLIQGDNIYETLRFPLPPHIESQPMTCPFEECRREFPNEEQLRMHLIHTHKSKKIPNET
jgi:hypothetical protein